ncbi:Peptidyl-Prolyl Cis-Trans Isomerase Fkbp4 [Manis pentadactyla]|nr:Peptidyl-Prolyl Cis-Trans Isomerase Fkbp4 [Manis pentadactyla]
MLEKKVKKIKSVSPKSKKLALLIVVSLDLCLEYSRTVSGRRPGCSSWMRAPARSHKSELCFPASNVITGRYRQAVVKSKSALVWVFFWSQFS